MSIELGENISSAFSYAFNNTFKHFGRWLGLSVLLLIPIANLIPLGIFLKTYRNEEPDFSGAGKSFVNGLLYFLITLVYAIIPFILILVLGGTALAGLIPAMIAGDMAGMTAALAGSLALVLVVFIVSILIAFVLIPGIINFARSGKFSGAFKFGEIFGMIKKAGVGHYILSFIVLFLIIMLIEFVIGLIAMIPILGFIVTVLATPFLTFVAYKFFGNLFEEQEQVPELQE